MKLTLDLPYDARVTMCIVPNTEGVNTENPSATVIQHVAPQSVTNIADTLVESDVQWVVVIKKMSDLGDLGVKIGNKIFCYYKGESIIYTKESNIKWRPVFKREFGESCHPSYYDLRTVPTFDATREMTNAESTWYALE